MNLEKNSRAKLIDTAPRTVGAAMAILMYATIVMAMTDFKLTSVAVNAPFRFYLISALLPSVMTMGMGMGLAYVRSFQALPERMAWLVIAEDAYFSTLFYLGWVATLIVLIWWPMFLMLSSCLFSCGLGYWIIARRRSRRGVAPETQTGETKI